MSRSIKKHKGKIKVSKTFKKKVVRKITNKELDDEIAKLKMENLFRCKDCGKPLIKISRYSYKGNCSHIPEKWRLNVG